MSTDSKRIEQLVPLIDVLLQAEATAPQRDAEEVFGELGLVKHPSTVLVAGDLAIATIYDEHLAAVRPYVGLAPASIRSFTVGQGISHVLSVENLTTFHELASQIGDHGDIVLIYSGGMPSPSWRRAYGLLLQALPEQAQVLHWGDIDAGGFRIAEHIARCCDAAGRGLRLHAMDAGQISDPKSRGELLAVELQQISRLCSARGWGNEAEAVARLRMAIEQESLPIEWPAL